MCNALPVQKLKPLQHALQHVGGSFLRQPAVFLDELPEGSLPGDVHND